MQGRHHLLGLCLAAAVLVCGSEADAQTLDLKANCHAVGDGIADDAPALAACLTMLAKAAHPAALHVPAGIFRISGAAGPMPVLPRGVAIEGEGPHASTLKLEPDFAGDVLAWDEAWGAGTVNERRVDLAHDVTGPTVTGLRITGTRDAPHRQNALVFYDRNDDVLLRDVEVSDIGGDCLSVGRTRRMPVAYMRESAFFNVRCFGTGASDGAAVTLGSTDRPGSDASNEIDIYKLAVFDARGQGVAIRNSDAGNATRGIRVFGLRVEKTGAEGVAIGEPQDKGQVAGIAIFNLTVINAHAAALRVAADLHGPQPYGIRIDGGSLGPGNARGIEIDNGRLIDIALDGVDAPIVLGPNAGSDIRIEGNGSHSSWRFAGAKAAGDVSDSLEVRSPFNLRGLPGAGDRVGTAALKAGLQGGAEARLTMDGAPASPYNCFNPGYAQSYSLGIRVLLQDRDKPDRFFNWTMQTAVLSAWYGPGSADLTPGPAEILQRHAEDASIIVGADRKNGCLSLLVRAPKPGSERWSATGLITYARAP